MNVRETNHLIYKSSNTQIGVEEASDDANTKVDYPLLNSPVATKPSRLYLSSFFCLERSTFSGRHALLLHQVSSFPEFNVGRIVGYRVATIDAQFGYDQ